MYLFPIEVQEVRIVSVAETEAVQQVFARWKQYHPRAFPRVHSGLPEWVKVKARLNDGYTVKQLCDAIDGMHASPFHQGENKDGKKYLSLELCMRSSSKVEQFLQSLEEHGAPVLSEKTRRTLRAGESWLARSEPQEGSLEHETDRQEGV